jgi:hypothetical protein
LCLAAYQAVPNQSGIDKKTRPVDWIRDSQKSISNRLSSKGLSVHADKSRFRLDHLSERLGALLLERLPPDLAHQMMAMLPDDEQAALRSLHQSAGSESDESIGYPTFVERAALALGVDESDETIREIADAFLWGVVEEMPGDFKVRLTEVLPAELKSRMDLYSERENESKVA